MSYSEKFQCQWWGQPRTGSRVLVPIQQILGFSDCNTHDCNIKDPSWDTIITVRNPYSRMVSFWLLRHRLESSENKNVTFDQWVNQNNEYYWIKDDHPWNPISKLKSLKGKVHTISNENVLEDLMKLTFITENLTIIQQYVDRIERDRHLDRKEYLIDQNLPYSNFYNQKLADIVYENKKEEFHTWGYEKDSWRYLRI
jgi:hypothetical protein